MSRSTCNYDGEKNESLGSDWDQFSIGFDYMIWNLGSIGCCQQSLKAWNELWLLISKGWSLCSLIWNWSWVRSRIVDFVTCCWIMKNKGSMFVYLQASIGNETAWKFLISIVDLGTNQMVKNFDFWKSES